MKVQGIGLPGLGLKAWGSLFKSYISGPGIRSSGLRSVKEFIGIGFARFDRRRPVLSRSGSLEL